MAVRKRKTRAEIAAFKKKVAKKKVQKKADAARKKVTKRKVTKNKETKNTPTNGRKNRKKTSKFKEGVKKVGKVAKNVVKSPVGKLGIPGALATAAYFGFKEFGPDQNRFKAKKKTPKKVKVIQKNKPTGGGSIGRTSMKDFKPKTKTKTVTAKKKASNKRFDPRKANRAGQKFGQR